MSFRRTKGGAGAPEVRRNLLRPAFTAIVVKPDLEDFSFAALLSPPLLYRNDIFFFKDVKESTALPLQLLTKG